MAACDKRLADSVMRYTAYLLQWLRHIGTTKGQNVMIELITFHLVNEQTRNDPKPRVGRMFLIAAAVVGVMVLGAAA